MGEVSKSTLDVVEAAESRGDCVDRGVGSIDALVAAEGELQFETHE